MAWFQETYFEWDSDDKNHIDIATSDAFEKNIYEIYEMNNI